MSIKIDLFSDTHSGICDGMRKAIASAKVGNEVAGEDPTVNALLERVCDLLGKEAATFMPSGTMCNGIAYRVFCKRPGDFIILDEKAHPLHKASGLISGLAHAQPIYIKGDQGIFTAEQIRPYLECARGYNLSYPRLVSIEQTTNFGGGAIWPLETIRSVCDLAHRSGAYTHMDGARLFNASIGSGISLKEYAEPFDSVWIDFCKTLGAPMGAVIAGDQSFIDEVWYYKFQQGGGMHQAGILAAACLFGLDHNLEKIHTVHQLTQRLADRLVEFPFISMEQPPQTNILIFKIDDAQEWAQRLLEKGIRMLAIDNEHLRAILHIDICENDIETICQAIEHISLSRV